MQMQRPRKLVVSLQVHCPSLISPLSGVTKLRHLPSSCLGLSLRTLIARRIRMTVVWDPRAKPPVQPPSRRPCILAQPKRKSEMCRGTHRLRKPLVLQ